MQKQVFGFLQNEGELQEGFTPAEISHLGDVKQVMKYAEYVFYALLLIVTITLTYCRRDKELVLKLLGYGGKTTLLVMLLIFLISFFFFNELFTLFHLLFFPQGNWLFPADSMLIQIFPTDFFITISRNIFLLTLSWGILFILSVYYLRYVRGQRH